MAIGVIGIEGHNGSNHPNKPSQLVYGSVSIEREKGANFVLLCPSSWKLCFDYFPYFGFLSSSSRTQVTAI